MIAAVASQAPARRIAALAPLALLLLYALAFAAAALGTGPIAYDDHPGQLFRLQHVLDHGPAPWAWNDGWWTGYPELQFYPPGFAYAGALLHAAALGRLGVAAVYQTLVWLAYLAPGVTSWLLLRRVLGDGWAALPGALVALSLSLWPAMMSGVEGGVRVGMAPARLAWALLPLLTVALLRWTDGTARVPVLTTVPVVAAIVLTHPAHAPAAVVLVLLAAWLGPKRPRRMLAALASLGVAALLTAFWTVPLLAHLADTRALAWGTLTPRVLGDTLVAHPLALVLIALAVPALAGPRDAPARLVAWAPWVAAIVVALDAIVLQPLGLAWLPADRVLDSVWLLVVLAAGVTSGRLVQRLAARGALLAPAGALGAIGVAIALSLLGHDTLSLWPRAGAWPSAITLDRGLRLPALWKALREAPPGRALFVRSGVPIAFGTEWWRPHTHATALAPQLAGRAIVNGTFTHPSPVAALVYRGDAGRGPITTLVERLDGQSLFGRPLASLDATTLDRYTRPLGISVIVALDEDVPKLAALVDHPRFARRRSEPPFVLWMGPPVALPRPIGIDRWIVTVDSPTGGWTPVGRAYYPLWYASASGTPLATHRGEDGDLQVLVPPGPTTLELSYAPGAAERAGVALSVLGVLAWAVAAAWSSRRRGEAASPA
jgi:hypothetical protein